MEARYLFIGTSLISSFCAASLLAPQIISFIKRRMSATRKQTELLEQKGFSAALLRNGVVWAKPFARSLLSHKKIKGFFAQVQALLIAKSYTTTPLNLCSVYCTAMLLVMVVGLLLTASPVLGLVFAFGFSLITSFIVSRAREKRREALREAIPDALRSMSVCSHAGFSLQQTFHQVSKEVDESLASLFRTALHDLETGQTISQALEAFRGNVDISELAFVAMALDVQHRTGGSLQQVLDAACDSVESELSLKRTLRVQTTQAKLSARIVSVMPFILIALFSFLSPGFLAPFFGSVAGLVLLGLAAFMQIAGIFLVRRLLDVGID